jgi:hypothetical protein
MIHALEVGVPGIEGNEGEARLLFKKAAWISFGKPGD